jgi:hypothetical protein
MKQIALVLALVLGVSAFAAQPTQARSDLGVGVIVGEPTGISIKYRNFPIMGIAWSIENHLHLHADYWISHRSLSGPVSWYWGVGGKITFFDKGNEGVGNLDPEDDKEYTGVGVRVPVGLQYYILPELELFAEIVPGFAFLPGTDFELEGGIGARYYF